MVKKILSTLLIIAVYFSSPLNSFAYDGETANSQKESDLSFYQKIAPSGLSYESFSYGVRGYHRICDSLSICYRYLCIADFIKPSSEKRFYVIDMQDTSLFHSDYVAHGRNSGELHAETFSNEISSYQSSLGFYLVSEAYDGKHGLSLRLDGLDSGFNDNARDRAIVMHAAEYAEPSFISANGRLGRSQGCPALPQEGFAKVAPFIKEKCVLFIYYPKMEFLTQSVWLKETEDPSDLVANESDHLLTTK